MTWSTAWFIDGDSETTVLHDASVVRVQTYASFNGGEGVINPTDLRVLELSTPGTSVRVMPGACCVLNRALGGENEAYAAKLSSQDEVAITPTGSGSGRSDLIIVRVENPFLSGEPWTDLNPPFVYSRVIEDVPPNTKSVHDLGLGYSAITLARLDIPSSTGTITNSMVVNLRETLESDIVDDSPDVEPASYVFTTIKNGPGSGYDELLASETSFIKWPPTSGFLLPVPRWATHYHAQVHLTNLQLVGGDFVGEARLHNVTTGSVSPAIPIDYIHPGSTSREHILIGGGHTSSLDSIRGTASSMEVQCRSTNSGLSGSLRSDKSSLLFVTFNFMRLSTLT